MPDYVIALATQLPLIAAFFYGLRRGWFFEGGTVSRERDEAIRERNFLITELATARAERKEAEDRLDAFRVQMKDQTDVLEKSVSFNERLIAELEKRR